MFQASVAIDKRFSRLLDCNPSIVSQPVSQPAQSSPSALAKQPLEEAANAMRDIRR